MIGSYLALDRDRQLAANLPPLPPMDLKCFQVATLSNKPSHISLDEGERFRVCNLQAASLTTLKLEFN
jgi:hypothetical protein